MPRRTNYMAKHTLFDFWPLAWLLRQIDTIPIDRSGGASAMKETLKRLRRHESILIFPEGHRTRDGQMQRFRPGFVALAKRVQSPVLPVGLDGTFECWPPGKTLPKPGFIHVVFGEPIQPSELTGLDDDQITDLLRQRVAKCFELARYFVNESKFDRHP